MTFNRTAELLHLESIRSIGARQNFVSRDQIEGENRAHRSSPFTDTIPVIKLDAER